MEHIFAEMDLFLSTLQRPQEVQLINAKLHSEIHYETLMTLSIYVRVYVQL